MATLAARLHEAIEAFGFEINGVSIVDEANHVAEVQFKNPPSDIEIANANAVIAGFDWDSKAATPTPVDVAEYVLQKVKESFPPLDIPDTKTIETDLGVKAAATAAAIKE